MSILQALASHYDRLVSKGDAPDYGYSQERISFALVLSPEGDVVDVVDWRNVSLRRPRPRLCEVPRPDPSRTSTRVVSNFLWDKSAYVLGVKLERDTRQPISADREHDAFRLFHDHLLTDATDDGLKALRAFLGGWRASSHATLPHAGDLLDANIVFQLDGERRLIHQRPAARRIWGDHLASLDRRSEVCLVSGVSAPIERLHPKVKGVAGAQSSGAAIVSFNLDAFTSYGKEQGANAPVSKRAAFAYTAALNSLLTPDRGRRIRVGDATTVFWADAPGDEAAASKAEDLFSMLADPPPTDEGEAAQVRGRLESVAAGQPIEVIAPEVNEHTRFYVLGLSPNAARLSSRFWFEDTIGAMARRIGEHWGDLRLDPVPWVTAPAAWRLLYETAVQRKSENISPTLGGALMRAILTGSRYPQSLLAAVIMRVRADGAVTGVRAAIAKACVRRAERLSNPNNTEDRLVSLDRHSHNAAYNLGRLFAAYAYAEKSIADRNATIRDKYAGSASATPRRVFPMLMRGYEHNRAALAKASDGQKRSAGRRADREVGQILERLPGSEDLPATLSLEDQARFFVGYYHQETAFYTKTAPEAHQRDPVNSEE